jgi:hypothetical protein
MTLPTGPSAEPTPKTDIWFEYTTSAGRFTAIPVSPMGWVVLCGGILVPLAVMTLAAPLFIPLPIFVKLPFLFAVIVGSVLGVMKIAIAKGRRRR